MKIVEFVNQENKIYNKKNICITYLNNYFRIEKFNYEEIVYISKVLVKQFLSKTILNYTFITYYIFKINNQIIKTKNEFKYDSKYLINIICKGSLKLTENILNNLDLERKIEEIKITKVKPKLLIHACCGPCSSYVLEKLHPYFNIDIDFYNPNIYDFFEYQKRINTQIEIINKLKFFDILIYIYDYSYEEFKFNYKGLENYPEGGKRCFVCYSKRLEEVYKKCLNLGYDYYTTTLSISPYKNSNYINTIGLNLDKTKFLYSNFKENDGYKKSIELSKKYNLYRQDYCGCFYSIKK